MALFIAALPRVIFAVSDLIGLALSNSGFPVRIDQPPNLYQVDALLVQFVP